MIMKHIDNIQHDILDILNDHGGEMTYVIKNILVAPYYGYNYDWHYLKTSRVLYNLRKLEGMGLVSKVTGASNPYKTQLKWMLAPVRPENDQTN